MLDFFKKPVFIIIVVVAIIVALVWSYVARVINQRKIAQQNAQQTTTESVKDLTNVDPAEYDEPTKKEYAVASTKAVEADSKNALAAMVVELPASLGVSSGNVRYIFTSNLDPTNNWTITFSQETGNYIRAVIPKDDYMGNVPGMDTKLWKFNYVTALQIAEKEGGKDWRDNNELKGVTETLKHSDPNNWLTWTVEYQGVNSVFSTKIDANSGKVVTE